MFSYVVVAVFLMGSLRNFHVSGCDFNCADKPVFTPSRLVVKYGDSASAECVACTGACQNTLYNLEKSVGDVTRNGTTLLWTVGSLTEWDPSPDCYYNTDTNKQCCSTLPVIVYQPPESVSFSFINHTGPMFEHNQYTLQCTVENVAPVGNLVVTFYRGQTALDQQKSRISQLKPVSDTFTLNINVSKEDDGAQYWCEAKLELGPEGPQRPPVVASENITATVYYGPRLLNAENPNPIKITEGHSLRLNCSAVGNPIPSYTWTVPSASSSFPNDSVLTINSVNFEHEGQYTCTVSCMGRTVDVTFAVDVQADVIPYIIAAAVIAAVVIIAAGLVVYFQYYRHSKMGQYKLKDVLRSPKREAVPLQA
ncbi:cell adhesion molecule 3-like [Stegastes partitus]|uniref:Cell adhesion molecule 3-like n=1 Tax=Stegastes partitus TaxID=144197 RepID=A0A3B5ACG2_9TELE|nr:PREDICTED: cell adhesion molecule 3-like [Stegastes partitus]